MQNIIIDDTDISILRYAGDWNEVNVSSAHNGSLHGASLPGSEVNLIFHGTAIQVVSALRAGVQGSVTSYVLDDTQPVLYYAPTVAKAVYGQPFYTSAPLSDGAHSLIVTIYSNSSFEYWLDCFVVTQNNASFTSSSNVPAVTSVNPTALTTPTGSQDQGTGSSSRQPVFIVGIVLGILGILAVVIVVIWLCVRQRRARKEPMVDEYHNVYTDSQPYSPPTAVQNAHTTPLGNTINGPQTSTMVSSSSLPTPVTKGILRYGYRGLRVSPTVHPQQIDGVTERSPHLHDVPPAYSSPLDA
ncbi:hypothetical protein BDW22DRAFT_1357960 [Trametopsis cervina]|nr:hypothetical protein BDW22DRAFT_1357960 [Trametopsis cervina]